MLNPNMAMILISTQSVTIKWLIFNLNFVQPADRSACSTFYLPPAGFLFYRRLVGLSSTGSSFSTYNRSSSETPTAMSLATFTSPLTMSSALQGTQLHFSIWACREHNSTSLYEPAGNTTPLLYMRLMLSTAAACWRVLFFLLLCHFLYKVLVTLFLVLYILFMYIQLLSLIFKISHSHNMILHKNLCVALPFCLYVLYTKIIHNAIGRPYPKLCLKTCTYRYLIILKKIFSGHSSKASRQFLVDHTWLYSCAK